MLSMWAVLLLAVVLGSAAGESIRRAQQSKST
jgi:hypothetical protein